MAGAQPVQKGRNDLLEVGLQDVQIGPILGLQPGAFEFIKVRERIIPHIRQDLLLQFLPVSISVSQQDLQGGVGLLEAAGLLLKLQFPAPESLFRFLEGRDVFMAHHHPGARCTRQPRGPHVKPSLFVRGMAGIVDDKLLHLPRDDGPDPSGHLGSLLRPVPHRRFAQLDVVDRQGIRPHPDCIGSRKFFPGAVGFDNDSVLVEDGDVRGQRVQNGFGEPLCIPTPVLFLFQAFQSVNEFRQGEVLFQTHLLETYRATL